MQLTTTQADVQRFKQASRKDRIRACRFNTDLLTLLSNDETDYYHACHKAFHLLVGSDSETDAIQSVMETLHEFDSYYKAKQLITNVVYIYNDVFSFNKQLENHKYVHQQKAIAKKALVLSEANGDAKMFELASKAFERAAKAGGYDTPTVEQDTTELPKYVLITSNPKLLEAQKNNETLIPKQLL